MEVKWLGSVYDGRVFVNLRINKFFREERFFMCYREILFGYEKIFVILVGDFVYFLFLYYIKEFFNIWINKEVIFNNMFRSVRNLIECVIGCFKVRW